MNTQKPSLFFAAALFASVCGASGVEGAIGRGAEYLISSQSAEGFWSDPQMPALTALPLWALSGAGVGADACRKAAGFVLSTQRDDGGFYVPKPGRGGSGLGNYNTAVCLSALFESGLAPAGAMLKAREYIASSQLSGDDTMAGGFGYDKISRRRYADLSNSCARAARGSISTGTPQSRSSKTCRRKTATTPAAPPTTNARRRRAARPIRPDASR